MDVLKLITSNIDHLECQIELTFLNGPRDDYSEFQIHQDSLASNNSVPVLTKRSVSEDFLVDKEAFDESVSSQFASTSRVDTILSWPLSNRSGKSFKSFGCGPETVVDRQMNPCETIIFDLLVVQVVIESQFFAQVST